MRALPGTFVLLVMTSACDGAVSGDAQVACDIDRDCQDGDLCNGAERCVAGVCAASASAAAAERSACLASEDACGGACLASEDACGGACASGERCERAVCVAACLPPTAPVWSQVTVGTRLVFPTDTIVDIDAAQASIAPASPEVAGPGVTFTDPGRVAIEARWKTPEAGCEAAAFSAVYEIVGAVEADPERAPDAIAMDDPRLFQWAAGWDPPAWGGELDPSWQDLTRALGPATGAWDDATSLGNGGALTLVFEAPIADGPGPDLAVFENGFSERFLELAWVEVSSNGRDFVRFASLSLQREPVAAYGTLDPREVLGVAGRFRGGFGVTFDLGTLAQAPEVLTGRVDLSAITHVRVVDIVGDGAALDALGQPIYDPTPTFGSAGFDLEAIGAIAP